MGKASKQSNGKPSKPASSSTEQTSTQQQEANVVEANSFKSLWTFDTQKAINLLALAALYGPLSQAILAPVYGSIPSATYHKYILTASSLLAFSSRDVLPIWITRTISPIAYWIPSLQFVLFQYSNQLDQFGPLVTELLTTFPLLTLSVHAAMKLVEDIDLPILGSSEAGPPMIIYFVFLLFQQLVKNVIPSIIGWNVVFSRIGLQLAIATLYGIIIPQSFFWPAIPSIAFTMIANPHLPLRRNADIANSTLSLYNYTLLERHESVTGYLSILQNNELKFRIMRCDHSLLGGEWQIPVPAGVYRPVGETIYPVFTMLEAVRLIEAPSMSSKSSTTTRSDAEKSALTIGLGTGSAPSAFIAHGINTTILELDPIVHYYAGKYFNLPRNHSYYIGDAVDFIHSRAAKLDSILASSSPSQSMSEASSTDIKALQYDYILHDTFTGGALPIPLFTQSFLKSLSSLIKPTGVIAINYAGDLDLPSAALVHRTITSVFDRCRIFREDVEQPKPSDQKKPPKKQTPGSQQNSNNKNYKDDKKNDDEEEYLYEGDFTNLVYFCLPPSAAREHRIQFRNPTDADFLGSAARRHYMFPKHELSPADQRAKFGPRSRRQSKEPDNAPTVLDGRDRNSVKLVEKYQAQSAFGHWKLMRTVIRPEVWEVW